MNLIIGCHVSYKNNNQLLGCVDEALDYGGNAFMFYTGAPQNTRRSEIKEELTFMACEKMRDNDIDMDNVIVHAPYIVNLCNEEKFDFSVEFLKKEVERCSKLNVKKMVLHPGSAVGLEKDKAISNIIKGLNIVLDNNYDVTICLETMAGKGTEIGRSFEELKMIIDGVENKDKIGVCLDTCHINDAGYDVSKINSVLDNFDNIIGLSYLKCVHINDSKNVRGSNKDRHENIGYGSIGFNNLIKVIYNKKLKDIPKILETPYVDKEYPPYLQEIEMIKRKEFNENLLDDVRDYYKNGEFF